VTSTDGIDELDRTLDGIRARLRGADVDGGVSVEDLVSYAITRADADDLADVAWAVADTPIGPLTLAATPAGLVRVGFDDEDRMLDDLASHVSPRVVRLPARLDEARRQLDEYFAGRRRGFEVRLDRRLSRGYRLTVLEELSRVPYGQTVSYKDLAERTGHPKASRAVGTAMATNPIPVVVPCHRVLRTGGALGGYGGGLDTKVWLLRHEGALLS
jgi:methylated-DNA-[protein]-cysteine S-methyltransferase